MSVADRLGRLLFIVPYVADRDGVPLQELAEKLEVKPRQIEADLALLCMVGQPPLTPDHLIDIFVEDDIVYVELDQALSRPLRLTHEEASSLVLAAKLVGGLGGLGSELDSIVDCILEQLNPVDGDLVRELSARISFSEDDRATRPATVLRESIDGHEEVEVEYYSVSSDRQKTYRLHPLALISHTGSQYLAALDVEAEGQEKLFRTDRMARVTRTGARFEAPDDFDIQKYRADTLYFGASDTGAEVHFGPNTARLARERFSKDQVTEHDDGSVTVRLSTSSPAWLARWVLPFGTDAEIKGPSESREQIGAMCRAAAAAYAREV